ncbi:MAG: hypothetical protein KDJ45_00110 [Hyphomicrobiaceae bacterium]|nr:hypothetical protein [Hyphomicrobiaceae bacterium]MCC0009528.1 hypothetical protein [Hyphomicrobiaceae bacterium]
MAQTIVDEIGQILPPTRNLAETLGRAADYATQQGHRDVSLEHLLLALTEDPDASRVMTISQVAIEQLKGDVATHLGHIDERSEPGATAGISNELRQVLEAAAAAARGRRNAIDGAIVLAAIVGDGRSTAAHLLRAHGLTFEEAIKALQSAVEEEPREDRPGDNLSVSDEDNADSVEVSAPPGRPAEHSPPVRRFPQETSADDILATARQRVEGRFAPGLPDAEDTFEADGASAADGPGRHNDDKSEHARPAPIDEFERPAPAAKRPSPPGAIRGPIGANSESAGAPGPTDEPSVAAAQARFQHADKSIDEVLSSIRRKGGAGQGSIAVPPGAHIPDPPQKTKSDGPPTRRDAPPFAPLDAEAGGARPSPEQMRPPGAGGQRPSDQDFFGGRSPGRRQQRGTGAAPAAQAPVQGPSSAPVPTPVPAPSPAMPPSMPPARPPGQQSAGGLRQPVPPVPHPQANRGGAPGAGHASRPPPPTAPQGQGQWPRMEPGLQRPPGAPPPHAPGVPPGVAGQPHMPPLQGQPKAAGRPRQRSAELAAGQMVENIPRVMRVGVATVVEARIARAEVKALAEGLQGGGSAWRHDLTVTKAMSVRLRAPDGGFFIETNSPETQWIENTLGFDTDDYASWRWSVTPKERGAKRLQLIISARTVGTDGLAAETALPDQVVDVKVRINYGKTAKRWGGWALAAVLGGVLARFGEDLPATLMNLIGTVVK